MVGLNAALVPSPGLESHTPSLPSTIYLDSVASRAVGRNTKPLLRESNGSLAYRAPNLCPHGVKRNRLMALPPDEECSSLRHRGGQRVCRDAGCRHADTNHRARDNGDPSTRSDTRHDRVVRAEFQDALRYHLRSPEPRL